MLRQTNQKGFTRTSLHSRGFTTFSSHERGFTLIELLIVIGIIGILATIATVSLGASQQRARDAQRKSDLKQVANALEIYYNTYAAYPVAVSGAISGAAWGASWANYMRIVPTEPLTGGTQYCYNSSGSPTINAYELYARIENSNDVADYKTPGSLPVCNGYSQYTYRLQNPF